MDTLSVRLQAGSRSVDLRSPAEGNAVALADRGPFRTRAEAAAFLRAFSRDADSRRSLRALLGDLGVRAVDRLDDDEVLEACAAQVHARRLVPVPVARRAAYVPPAPEEDEAEGPQVVVETEETWIAVRFLDEQGRGLAGEPYRIKLPNQDWVEAKLDADGYARHDGIEPGTAIVELMDADESEWDWSQIADTPGDGGGARRPAPLDVPADDEQPALATLRIRVACDENERAAGDATVTLLDQDGGALLRRRTRINGAGWIVMRNLPEGAYQLACDAGDRFELDDRGVNPVALGAGQEREIVLQVLETVLLCRLKLFRGTEARQGTADAFVFEDDDPSDRDAEPLAIKRGLPIDDGVVIRTTREVRALAGAVALYIHGANGEEDGLYLHLADGLDPTREVDVDADNENARRILWALGMTDLEPRVPAPDAPGLEVAADLVASAPSQRLRLRLALGWFQRRLGADATLPHGGALRRLWEHYRSWDGAALHDAWRLYPPRRDYRGDHRLGAARAPEGGFGWDAFHDYLPDATHDLASLVQQPTARERNFLGLLSGAIPDFHDRFMASPAEAPRAQGAAWNARNVAERREILAAYLRDNRQGFLRELSGKCRNGQDYDANGAAEQPELRLWFFVYLGSTRWPEVKSELLESGGDGDAKRLMVGALIFRKAYFWNMFRAIDAAAVRALESPRRLYMRSVGSNDLTSDIDVTVSGALDVPAMRRVFDIVREKWGKPSPALFDTMLYGRDWLMVNDNILQRDPARDNHYQVSSFDPIADLYGLAAIHRYAEASQWRSWVDAVRRDVLIPGTDQPPPMFARLGIIEDLYHRQYVEPLAGRLGVAAVKEDVEEIPHHGDEAQQDDFLAAMNATNVDLMGAARVDEESVLAARHPEALVWVQNDGAVELTHRIEGGVGAAIAWIERQNQIIPQQALYAYEGYFTPGAMNDVVGTQGGVRPPNLTVHHMLQSFNDQAADALKELHEYLGKHEEHAGPGTAEGVADARGYLLRGVFRASKYEIRMSICVADISRLLRGDHRVERRIAYHRRLFGQNPSLDEQDLAALAFERLVAERFDAHANELLKIRKERTRAVDVDAMMRRMRGPGQRVATSPREKRWREAIALLDEGDGRERIAEELTEQIDRGADGVVRAVTGAAGGYFDRYDAARPEGRRVVPPLLRERLAALTRGGGDLDAVASRCTDLVLGWPPEPASEAPLRAMQERALSEIDAAMRDNMDRVQIWLARQLQNIIAQYGLRDPRASAALEARDQIGAATPMELADRVVSLATRFDSPLMRLVRDPSRSQYARLEHDARWDPDRDDLDERTAGHFVWCYRTLAHHLLTHAAIVNRAVRSILSRGPMDTWVRRAPADSVL
jgi:hypothetical protein